ncbi:uncharacterized protein [Nicotiana tomentosiformis]|uniref:uncharacterized protein isoform X2 n=1 Tax=Nicotiana tomentosiformis TaxID=4098 RepID=UPI000878E07A|nr:uncharacterized protein LOC108946747 isoform X2 [Nicotiana tomentosiformis]
MRSTFGNGEFNYTFFSSKSHADFRSMEEQVAAVLYGEDIEKYADKLTPFSTYLISTTKVRVPLPYGVPINRFEWVIDKFSVVEEVKDDNIQDPPLPPPTRLNTVPFAYLHEQQRNTEFDIIAIVVNCGSIKYVGANSNKYCKIIVMDTNMKPIILTLWEDFADVDGRILAAQVAEYPIIVAKQITRANYVGMENITLFYFWYCKRSVVNSLLT